jgi:hypothetical protein
MPAIPRREASVPAVSAAPAGTAMPSAAIRPSPALEHVAVATSGVAPAIDAATAAARAELERREALVRQREAELAEQRRVLAEEYRLLRAQRTAPVASISEPPLRFQVAGGAPAAYDTETFWTRLKRFMLGVSPS